MRIVLISLIVLLSLPLWGRNVRTAWCFDSKLQFGGETTWQASGWRNYQVDGNGFTGQCSAANNEITSPEITLDADKNPFLELYYHATGSTMVALLMFSRDGKNYRSTDQVSVVLDFCNTYYPKREVIRMNENPAWKGTIKQIRLIFLPRTEGNIVELYGLAFTDRKNTLYNGDFLLVKNFLPVAWQCSVQSGRWQGKVPGPEEHAAGHAVMQMKSSTGGTAELSTDLPHLRQDHVYAASFQGRGNGKISGRIELLDRAGQTVQSVPLTAAGPAQFNGRFIPSEKAFSGRLVIGVTGTGDTSAEIAAAKVEYLGTAQNWRAEWIWGEQPAVNNQDYYFRKEVNLDPEKYRAALLQVTGDDQFGLAVNGQRLTLSNAWADPRVLEILPSLKKGKNVITVSAHNNTGAAGLLMEIKLTPRNAGPDEYVVTDSSWQCSPDKPDSAWTAPEFAPAAGTWKNAVAIGKPPVDPWSNMPYVTTLPPSITAKPVDHEKYKAPLTVEFDRSLNYPRLKINGTITPPLIYGPRWMGDPRKSLADSVKAGFHLYRVPYEFSEAWRPGFEIDFQDLDQMAGEYLAANPDAYLIIMFRISAPGWWMEQNPGELCRFSDGTVLGHYGILPAIASQKWRNDVNIYLKKFITHVENSWYGSRVIGYMPGSHAGPEWIITTKPDDFPDYSLPMQEYFRKYLRRKYGNDRDKLRQAWHQPSVTFENAAIPDKVKRSEHVPYFLDPATAQDVIDYNRCHQESVTDAMLGFQHLIKGIAPRKLNFVYYGYLSEMATQSIYPETSGHYDLERVLQSPDVDVVASPVTYAFRDKGDVSGCSSVETSYRVHGKLWLQEADTRSNLTVDSFNNKHSFNLRDAIYENQREFIYALTRRQGLWFYDMTGGWYDNPEYFRDFQQMHRAFLQACRTPISWQTPIAVFFDEKVFDGVTLARQQWGGNNLKLLSSDFRRGLGRCGIPYDLFEQEDIYRINPRDYRCYIFVNAWRYDEKLKRYLQEKILRNGNTVIWIYAPGAAQTSGGTDRMTDLAGIRLTRGNSAALAFKLNANHAWFRNRGFAAETFGRPGMRPADVFQVKDPRAEILGTYADTGEVAMALRQTADYKIIYLPIFDDTGRLWKQIFTQLKFHLFIDTTDRVSFDGRFLGVYLVDRPGERTVSLPGEYPVWDVFNQKTISGGCRHFSFRGEPGEARLFYLGDPADLR